MCYAGTGSNRVQHAAKQRTSLFSGGSLHNKIAGENAGIFAARAHLYISDLFWISIAAVTVYCRVVSSIYKTYHLRFIRMSFRYQELESHPKQSIFQGRSMDFDPIQNHKQTNLTQTIKQYRKDILMDLSKKQKKSIKKYHKS